MSAADAPQPDRASPSLETMPPPVGQQPVWAEAGPHQPTLQPGRSRRRLVLFWGGIAVVVAAALFGLADWAARTYEMSRLLDRVESSEAAMTRYQDRVRAIDVPDDPTDSQREQAEAEFQSAATQGRAEVADAGAEVATVSFLPWHGDLLAAQQSYLAHNRAWVDHLRRGSEDVTVLLGEDPMIDSTWALAELDVRGAEPWPTLPGIRQRVDEIFAPAPTEDPGSTPGLPA